jgi:hypothetical protein
MTWGVGVFLIGGGVCPVLVVGGRVCCGGFVDSGIMGFCPCGVVSFSGGGVGLCVLGVVPGLCVLGVVPGLCILGVVPGLCPEVVNF